MSEVSFLFKEKRRLPCSVQSYSSIFQLRTPIYYTYVKYKLSKMAGNFTCAISHLAGSYSVREVPGTPRGRFKGHTEFLRLSTRTSG